MKQKKKTCQHLFFFSNLCPTAEQTGGESFLCSTDFSVTTGVIFCILCFYAWRESSCRAIPPSPQTRALKLKWRFRLPSLMSDVTHYVAVFSDCQAKIISSTACRTPSASPCAPTTTVSYHRGFCNRPSML